MGNIPADETFDGTYPFMANYTQAPGFKMHYIDEGEGEPIVLVHGFPTWSYLYRHYVPPLSKKYRVIATDHMGYGKSESPRNGDYTFAGHSKNFDKFILDLDLKDITLVLHDIGGPIGAGFAFRHPDRIKRLVIQNTVMLGIDLEFEGNLLAGPENAAPYLMWIAEKHSQGVFQTMYDNMDTTLGGLFVKLPLITKTPWTPLMDRAYTAPFKDKENRAAVEEMARRVYTPLIEGKGVPDVEQPSPEVIEKLRAKPKFMVCGMKDVAAMPNVTIKIFKHQFPGAPVVELPNSAHFVPEDAHEAISGMIDLFMQMT